MKHTRLVSPILTLVTAIATTLATASLTAVPAASASAPEFVPGTLNIAVGEGSTVALETASTKPIECNKAHSTGEITGAKTVGGLVVTFQGCHSKEGAGCTLKSGGGTAGELVSNTLDGELGSVKKTESASGVGLLILPTAGTTFAILEGTCLEVSPSPFVGTIAAEVTPLHTFSKDGKLIYEGSKGAQKIKEINILGSIRKPEAFALGLIKSSESGVGLALLENAVEVT